MLIENRRSFTAGFICALVLTFAIWAYFNLSPHGGHVEDSPSGKYTISITSPMEPVAGGTYTVHLLEKPENKVLRKFTLQLNSTDSTLPLRGEQVSIQWNAEETFADISVRDEFLLRVSLPRNRD